MIPRLDALEGELAVGERSAVVVDVVLVGSALAADKEDDGREEDETSGA